ncbi:AbrB/MazE/SpoVT family DNA-binding domain-containing protein [Natrinema sp. CGMCC1.2065]|uniref:AbrB/MazE/SpoVT family DNA-binding domain-containing protein n=1 Tax=Natrinema sp. CGMCC1.2065 TaxID=3445767 RepID=UPI003F49D716
MAERANQAITKRCTVTLTNGGKVTIPKNVRENLSVQKGDSLELYVRKYEQNAQVITEV